METRALKPYFVVITLLLLTSLALAVTVNVQISDEAGIKFALPDKVGDWEGHEIRFCQNSECQKQFRADALEDYDVCPECGGELRGMTFGESQMLPADTRILKKQYIHPSGKSVFVAIVLSGKERVSIHRPQICLVGQGREIVESSVLSVPVADRKPLDVMVLDMLNTVRGSDGQTRRTGRYYAYWFVGKGRETPYHIQRMFWMAFDRIFFNVSHRWAYISVSGSRNQDSSEHCEQVSEFVSKLYPEMIRPES